MNNDTIALLRAVENGEPDAETAFFNHFFETLSQLTKARIPSKYAKAADGEDVALTSIRTFLRRAKEGEYRSMKDSNHPRRLIIEIAVNRALNAIKYERRMKRDQARTIGDSDVSAKFSNICEFLDSLTQDSVQETDKQKITIEFSDIIEQANEMLTDRERLIFEMSANGMTNSEIAAKFGVDQSTIWRTLEAISRRWRRRFSES